MAYEDNSVYSKYLGSGSSTEGCADGGCHEVKNDCDCCPPGLVKATGPDGSFVGCLTPADAAQFATDTRQCTDGYVALVVTATSKFMGCVPAADFVALNTAINP